MRLFPVAIKERVMRSNMLATAVCLVATSVGVCQQSFSGAGPATRRGAFLGAPQPDYPGPSPGGSPLPAPQTIESAPAFTDQLPLVVLQDQPNVPKPPTLSSPGNEEGSNLALQAEWDNGLWLSSKDQAFRLHVGGLLQFDAGWNAAPGAVQFGPGGIGELQDGATFRRARIQIDGQAYEHFEWRAIFDFANSVENDTGTTNQPVGSPSFIEVWGGVTDVPILGTVRAGWMKEPISFAHLTSSAWLNFMERPPGYGALSLTSPGIMLINWTQDQRMTWAAGFFHTQNDNFGFGFGDGQYAETGRLTCLLYYDEDGQELIHLGIGASHRHLNNDQEDLRARPSVRTMPGSLEPALAQTGTIEGSSQEVLDLELAAVSGPWTLQSEYVCTWIHDASVPTSTPPLNVGTLFYQGGYLEVLYFLTGEHRDYDKKTATFGRVVPLNNFNIWGPNRGWGAWQVGFRYGYLDFRSGGVPGTASLEDLTFGVNWFLTPNIKVQWNLALDYRSSSPGGSSGWTYIGGARLSIDF
jgi:phosphate-selective porin OprO/OprP